MHGGYGGGFGGGFPDFGNGGGGGGGGAGMGDRGSIPDPIPTGDDFSDILGDDGVSPNPAQANQSPPGFPDMGSAVNPQQSVPQGSTYSPQPPDPSVQPYIPGAPWVPSMPWQQQGAAIPAPQGGQVMNPPGSTTGSPHTAAAVLALAAAGSIAGYLAYGAGGAAAGLAMTAGVINIYRAPGAADKSPEAAAERGKALLAGAVDLGLGAWVAYHLVVDHGKKMRLCRTKSNTR